jgi:hypothetical protein
MALARITGEAITCRAVIFRMTMSLERFEFWINLAAKVTGVVAILVPLCGFWRSSSRRRGQLSVWSNLTTFPVIGVIATLYVILGIFLWRPLPLNLSGLLLRLASLLIGSLLLPRHRSLLLGLQNSG